MDIIKRDNSKEKFNDEKIRKAILAAAKSAEETIDEKTIEKAIQKSSLIKNPTIEDIQNVVEKILMDSKYKDTAKAYILYREARAEFRKMNDRQVKTFNEIVEVADNDIKNENANINGNTPAGQMMKFASEASKNYALNHLISKQFKEAHEKGLIHIHDLDYYSTKSTTCCNLDLKELFENGFNTIDGGVREPQSIRAYSSLAAIALQSNQNEQHGGQAIPAFDFYMAPGVKKSFNKSFKHYLKVLDESLDDKIIVGLEKTVGNFEIGNKKIKEIFSRQYKLAMEDTRKETEQAMESFVHNMCTMHH